MQNDYAMSEGSKSEKMNGEVTYIDFSWVVHERCLPLFTRGACASRSALYSESDTIHFSTPKVCQGVNTSGCEDEVDTSCNALITSCNQSSLRPCGERWDGRRQVVGGGAATGHIPSW
jgi:hypothetical protein